MKIASISVLLLCLTITLLLVILFSLSLSVSKQHNPFLPTNEFVVVKRSCRVAVFFMFNVIIITIFRGSSAKPSAEDSDWFPSFHRFLVYEEEGEDGAKDEAARGEYYYYYSSDVEDGDDEYHGYDGYEEDNDDDGSDDDGDSEDDDDKDLERRIEEFIAMNYKQRREEMVYERLLCMAAAVELQVSSSSS
jgi:hypothetical protein